MCPGRRAACGCRRLRRPVTRSRPSGISGSPRSSMASIPERLTDVGGIYQKDTGIELSDLDPSELPYPYTTPVPPEVASPLDGVYVRVTPLEGLGQPAVALPIRCLRCIPFRVEAGVSTLTLYHGRYFLHHHLSNFRSLGILRGHGTSGDVLRRSQLPHGSRRLSLATRRSGAQPPARERSVSVRSTPRAGPDGLAMDVVQPLPDAIHRSVAGRAGLQPTPLRTLISPRIHGSQRCAAMPRGRPARSGVRVDGGVDRESDDTLQVTTRRRHEATAA